MLQECAWFDGPQAKLFHASKVTCVVGDDEITSRLDREFHNHIIFRVAQERAPQKEDRMTHSNGTMEIDEILDCCSGDLKVRKFSQQHVFIF